jgi:exopolyphosphatase/pppGpp-phosphohydrolase
MSLIQNQDMGTSLPASPTSSSSSSLFAAVDMGTNSFKLLIVNADRSGKFLTLSHLKESILLGLSSTPTTPFALQTLQGFQAILSSHHVIRSHTRCVATAATREAANRNEFVRCVKEKTGLEVEVLSGEEEARLVYLGVLQFLPVFGKSVLVIDIGGGSTEFVVGKGGKVSFGASLKLGHVSLTEKFVKHGLVGQMREYVRLVIRESGVVEKIKECGFEMVVGCSGTVRAIEKAVFCGYAKSDVFGNDNVVLFGECKRDWTWGFTRGVLRVLVERICEGGEEEKVRREGMFKSRSEFIVAGAVLLEEIFEVIGIAEMEVSGYALGEGVIAESLAKVYGGYDLNANGRWRSVVWLTTRFNSKKRMRAAAQCAGIAKVY